MLSDRKRGLIAAVEGALQRLEVGNAALFNAASEALGLNRSDMRCLALLFTRKRAAASEAASVVGLTRGAMTTALDRLEKAGYLRRVPDPDDRRGVMAELTETGRARIEALWSSVHQSNEALLADYRKSELKLVLRFLDDVGRLRRADSERLSPARRSSPPNDEATIPPPQQSANTSPQ